MFKIVAFAALVATAVALPLDEKIVNGTDAKLGEIPYIVSLRYSRSHTCGASIINPNWVVTAAHCISGRETSTSFSVQYGVLTISSDDKNSIKVVKIIKHKEYNAAIGYKNDIAVLKLESPIPLSTHVQPVKLPQQGTATPANAKAVLSGWGLPYSGGSVMKNLQKVEIQIYSDADCERIHAQTGPTNRLYHVCAGVPEGGKGQCSGDSGGPLVVDGVQTGIVSWSVKPCTVKGYPGVFAKISSYIDWINEQIKN